MSSEQDEILALTERLRAQDDVIVTMRREMAEMIKVHNETRAKELADSSTRQTPGLQGTRNSGITFTLGVPGIDLLGAETQVGDPLEASVFLRLTQCYNERAQAINSTKLSAIISFVYEKERELVLVDLIVLTVEAGNITAKNPQGYGCWLIQVYDKLKGLFTVVEQKVLFPRTVCLTCSQLGEVSVMRVGRIELLRIMLVDKPGIWYSSFLGLDLEEVDREGNHNYTIRRAQGKQLMANLLIPIRNNSVVASSTEMGSSSSSSTSISRVMFQDLVMTMTEKQHGKLSVASLVNACSRGNMLGAIPTVGTKVIDLCCSFTYAQMTALIAFEIPSIQYFKPCDRETMLECSVNKTRVAVPQRVVSTVEAMVYMQRAGLVVSRLFGLHERIYKKWQEAAGKM
jgi:hypothetical protein